MLEVYIQSKKSPEKKLVPTAGGRVSHDLFAKYTVRLWPPVAAPVAYQDRKSSTGRVPLMIVCLFKCLRSVKQGTVTVSTHGEKIKSRAARSGDIAGQKKGAFCEIRFKLQFI